MMINKSPSRLFLILAMLFLLVVASCSNNTVQGLNQASPTTTSGASGPLINPTINPSACAGLRGELEVMVMVGPAEAVGLEPFSVGFIPFSVTAVEAPYVVEGFGQLEYEDTLAEEWGSYSVYLVMDTTITGECVDTGSGELNLEVEVSGTQLIEVIADDFHGEYPWTGTHSNAFSVPLEDGFSIDGDGWAFTIHLQ